MQHLGQLLLSERACPDRHEVLCIRTRKRDAPRVEQLDGLACDTQGMHGRLEIDVSVLCGRLGPPAVALQHGADMHQGMVHRRGEGVLPVTEDEEILFFRSAIEEFDGDVKAPFAECADLSVMVAQPRGRPMAISET